MSSIAKAIQATQRAAIKQEFNNLDFNKKEEGSLIYEFDYIRPITPDINQSGTGAKPEILSLTNIEEKYKGINLPFYEKVDALLSRLKSEPALSMINFINEERTVITQLNYIKKEIDSLKYPLFIKPGERAKVYTTLPLDYNQNFGPGVIGVSIQASQKKKFFIISIESMNRYFIGTNEYSRDNFFYALNSKPNLSCYADYFLAKIEKQNLNTVISAPPGKEENVSQGKNNKI